MSILSISLHCPKVNVLVFKALHKEIYYLVQACPSYMSGLQSTVFHLATKPIENVCNLVGASGGASGLEFVILGLLVASAT